MPSGLLNAVGYSTRNHDESSPSLPLDAISSIKPLTAPASGADLESFWISQKVAKIRDGESRELSGIGLGGTCHLQSIQSRTFRLAFRDVHLRLRRNGLDGKVIGPKDLPIQSHDSTHFHEMDNADREDSIRNLNSIGGTLPNLFIYLIYNRRPRSKMADITQGGILVESQSLNGVNAINDLFINYEERKLNSNFDVQIMTNGNGGISITGLTGFAFIANTSKNGAERPIIHGYGEFVDAPGSIDSFASASGIGMPTLSYKKDSCLFKRVAVIDLDINEPFDSQLMDYYARIADITWKKLSQPKQSGISYGEFKLSLNSINIPMLESRSMLLFEASDLDASGSITATEFEIALMINDAYPADTRYSSHLEVFLNFDLDRCEELNLGQFIQCVNTLVSDLHQAPIEPYELSLLFKKEEGPNGRIDYNSFKKLWCMRITDAKRELQMRGFDFEEPYSKLKIGQLIRRVENIYRNKYKYRKALLEEINRDENDSSVKKFPSARVKIVQLRKEAKQSRDTKNREQRVLNRRRQRHDIAQSSIASRQRRSKILKEQQLRRQQKIQDSVFAEKIAKDHEISLNKKYDEYIQSRDENNASYQKKIQNSGADRFILRDRDMKYIPEEYYLDPEAQSNLTNLIIIDLSGNRLQSLPGLRFIFHLISLRKMVLSCNRLHELPSEISALKNLEILRIDDNNLTSLPEEMKELTSLVIFDISKNRISRVTKELCCLSSLKSLTIHSNEIVDISSCIKDMKKLEVIDLSRNKLCSLPESFGSLSQLIKADVSRNNLSDLPIEIDHLYSLEYLDLSYNSLRDFPNKMSHLCNLSTIKLQGNKFQHIPDCVQGWNRVVILECPKNQLSYVSRHIGSMKSIRHLSCPMNKLEKLPPEIGLLKDIVNINLHSNLILHLPVEIGALGNLQRLDVSHNKLSSLPHEFCLLNSLVHCDVSNNCLEKLPESFGALGNIKTLKMNHNQIQNLPESFQNLHNLQNLECYSNRLKLFSNTLCMSLYSLRVLDLASNSLTLLPAEIQKLIHLKVLNLRNNKLKALPIELSNLIHKLDSVDITQNPLKLLPFKFNSTWGKRELYENPSGYSNAEAINWLEEQSLFYKQAVEEWNATGNLHLAGGCLGVDDFIESLTKRFDNYSLTMAKNENKQSSGQLLRKDAYILLIKQFYFECIRTGNAPSYTLQDKDTERKVENEARQIQNQREKNAVASKKEDLENRAAKHSIYFGHNFNDRLLAADQKLNMAENKKREKEKTDLQHLLDGVDKRKKYREEMAAIEGEKIRIESKKEADKLISLSFEKYRNSQRTLPVETVPCWKKKDKKP